MPSASASASTSASISRSAYVIGLGKSGIAAARLLKCQGWQVTATDSGTGAALQTVRSQLEADGIAVELGQPFVPDPARMQQIVVSPGVRWDLPALVTARSVGIETIGEVELAWRSLQSYPWLGITGTNGKTTTTSLLAAIFQTAGLHAPACGNIGYATCELALKTLYSSASPPPLDWVIAELSSYQIEAAPTIAPQIAVWTTFTPDHLSRHYTLENYFNIKAHLLNQAQYQVLNGDDPYLRAVGGDRWRDACWTSVSGKSGLVANPDRGAYLEEGWAMVGQERIVPLSALRMVGSHNQQNLLLSIAAARLAGIEPDAIAHAIHSFPGVSHRLEYICTWKDIDFINDSKATNYDAAQVGLVAAPPPVVLIAGGEAKSGDDQGWLQTIQEKAIAVLLIGNAASAFAQRLQEMTTCPYEIVETMDRAVQRGAELAAQGGAKTVLLSPACASFDQYQNFEQRGDHFRQLCQSLH